MQIQKNDSAGLVLEGWGLWLRSGSAGALLYEAMAYRRFHVSDGVLVRSGFYISCRAVQFSEWAKICKNCPF